MSRKKIWSVILLSVVFAASAVGTTKAISEQDLNMYAQNDILFYDNTCDNSGSSNVSVCGANLPEETVKMLENTKIKEKAQKNMERYKYAEEKTGLSWQILAALHYREGGMGSDKSILNGEKLYNHTNVDGQHVSSNANEDAVNAAKHYIEMGKSIYGVDVKTDQSMDSLGKAFLAYNRGYMYTSKCGNGDQPYTSSPYVMNFYDESHMHMSWIHADSYCNGRKINGVEGKKNDQLGALTVLAYLCGSNNSSSGGETSTDTSSDTDTSDGGDDAAEVSDDDSGTASSGSSTASCNSCDQGSKNLNGTAVCLAWPWGTDQSKMEYPNGEASSAFNEAHEKVTSGSTDACAAKGASCDMFVATVVRWSGYDDEYPLGNVGTQMTHATQHPELWDVIPWDGDKSKVQGGDIIWENGGGHTYMIVEDSEGKIWVAAASHCDYFGQIKEWYSPRTPVKIIRAKSASNSTSGVSVTNGVTSSSLTGTVSNTGQGNGDINASAVALAWPKGNKKNWTKVYPKFGEYAKSIGGVPYDGKSCVIFVATVLNHAGVEDKKIIGKDTDRLREYLAKSDNWEEVKPSSGENLKESDLQPGDVLFYYGKGKSAVSMCGEKWRGMCMRHTSIYVDTGSDGKSTAEASRSAHLSGRIMEKPNLSKNMRAFRNKNQGGRSAGCDVCEGENGGGDGELAAGGYQNVKDANEDVMKEYKGLSNAQARSKYHIDVGCDGILIKNCPSFVKYFVNKYTNKTWTGATGNGSQTAGILAKKYNLPTGKQPKPYAVFSVASGTTMCGSVKCGHTGVVLGVDTTRNKIIIGEAGCSASVSWIGAHEYDLKQYTSGSYTYAYLDSILKSGGLAGGQ